MDSEKSKADSKNTTAISTLFVRNIPTEATNQQLEEFFSQIGPVRSCFIVTKKKENETEPTSEENQKEGDSEEVDNNPEEAKSNRGFGFVQFAVPQDAKSAIDSLSDQLFLNKNKLKLEFALKKGLPNSSKPQFPKKKAEKKQESAQLHPIKTFKPTLNTVKVVNIKPDTTFKQLKHKARKFGTIKNIFNIDNSLANDKDVIASGTALIQYSSNVEAKRAFSHLDKHIFKGQEISAAIITTQSNKEHRLIVRNLSFKLREKDIFSIFSKVGQVEEVVLPRKFVGGPLKGFAFVQMGNKDDAEKVT
ncbi:hypothetical protein BB560_000562 [Smittium megazygosporum]|uniref:RRM domain-containing protein n=1 Tax=Smittium megazygosporum TaxID=133381 RepID=A0A2T9ZJX9_9FUNG|nr:hypothetical protein BB560_000562 [Smittium megazygosporum]